MGYFGNLQVKRPEQFDGQLQVASPVPQPHLSVAAPVQQPSVNVAPPPPQPRISMAPPPTPSFTPSPNLSLPSASVNPGGGTYSSYKDTSMQHIPDTHSLLSKLTGSKPQAAYTDPNDIAANPSLRVPEHGDVNGLHDSLKNIDGYSKNDQVRLLQRSTQAGIVPHNIGKAYISQAIEPTLRNGQETDRSKPAMFAQSLEQNIPIFNAAAGLAKKVGTNLAAQNLYNQALNGKMSIGDVNSALLPTAADNGINYNDSTARMALKTAGQAGQGAVDALSFGVGSTAAKGLSKAPSLVNLGKSTAKFGAGYGFAGGLTQTAQMDNPNFGDLAKNIGVNAAQAAALTALTGGIALGGSKLHSNAVPLDERGSIGKDQNGKPIVNVDTAQHLFDNKPTEAYPSIARKYLNDNFKGQTFSSDEGGNITVGGRGIGKFTAPSANLSPNVLEAKMRLAPELPNAIQVSKQVSSAIDRGGKHGSFAKDGFTYHSFDFDVNGQRFRGTFNVGKKGEINNFYDVHPIKELPNGSSNLSGSPIQENGPTASPEGLPTSTIPPVEPKVNLSPTSPSKGFIIKEGPIVSGKRDVVRVRLNPETKQLEQHVESIDAPSASVGNRDPASNQTNIPQELQGQQLDHTQQQLNHNQSKDSHTTSSANSTPPMTLLEESLGHRLDVLPYEQQVAKAAEKAGIPLEEYKNQLKAAQDYAFRPEDVKQIKDEIQAYAEKHDVTKQQALEDLKQMQLDRGKPQDPNDGGVQQPTIEERRQIIKDNPYQETRNKIDLGVEDGNVKGAIAKALTKSEERNHNVKDAALKVNKLNADDKHLFYQWEDGANIDDLLNASRHPKKLLKAIQSDENAFDYHLALDRASGGSTLRQGNYGLPKYFKATKEQMDAEGIPDNQRFTKGNYTGFHDISAKYHSYLDAYRRSGLEPLYDNPAEAIMKYHDQGAKSMRDQALYTALAKAAPDHVAPLDVTSDAHGRQFTQAAGQLPFAASREMQRALKAFRPTWKSDNAIVDKVISSGLAANSKAKASLFFGAPFHYFNGYSRFVGLTAGSGHIFKLSRGTGESFGSAIIPGVNRLIRNKAERDGVIQYIKENGGVLHNTDRPQHVGGGIIVKMKDAAGTVSPFRLTNQNMSAFFDTMMINLGRALKNKGIESGSIEAQQAMAEYNRILGHYNARVEGGDPNVAKLLSGEALAPHWLRTQFGMIKDAGKYSLPAKGVLGKAGFEGTARHGLGMYNAGDIARTTLIGTRLAQGAFATIVTAIALGQAPTLKSLVDRFGASPANPVPNIDLGEKDKKGRHQVIDLPTDPIGLAVGLKTDPQHFTQSRFSPLISMGERFATNKDWNGQPLSDPNDPNALSDRIKGSLKGALPIGLQNFTNPNITTNQGLIQEVGGRVKTDPHDPQKLASQAYFDTKQQLLDNLSKGNYAGISGSLKNLDPAHAKDYLNDYNGAHPKETKDINGVSIPKAWDPNTASERKNLYTTVNKDGIQVLSPAFYIDKKLASLDPSRPHSPLLDLEGMVYDTDNPDRMIPKAQVAIDYTSESDPTAKAVALERQPWLQDFEKATIAESTNYKQNMTDYMKKQGWTQPVIDDYWNKHPEQKTPFKYPDIQGSTQDKIDALDTIDSNADRGAFIRANPDIGVAFNQIAQYTNKMRVARGQLEVKGYPQPSAEVQAVLDAMSKGDDKASHIANAKLIQGSPATQDYLSDVSAHAVEFEGAKARFKGENFDQKALKGIQNLGKYGIEKNADKTYSQIAGTLANGVGLKQTGQAYTPGNVGSDAAYLKNNPTALAAAANTLDNANLAGIHGHMGGKSKFAKTKKIKIKKVFLKRVKRPHDMHLGRNMKTNTRKTSGKLSTKINVKPMRLKLGITPQK